MIKNIIIFALLLFGIGVQSQDPVYIVEFEDPIQTTTSLTWTVRIKAATADFTLLSGNIRYNFNNSGLNTTTAPVFVVTHASFVLDNTAFLGTVPNRYVNLAFSSPVAGAVVNSSTGIVLGYVTHLKAVPLTGNPSANVWIRAWNVSGYTNPLPASSATNCTRIFTGASPGAPVQSGTPVNLPGITLPIDLEDFTAEKAGERSALLKWITVSENNSSHFEIERSENGSRWEQIGRVQASVYSKMERRYRYMDDKLPRITSAGKVMYYRLKMVDRDGRYQYSEMRTVVFEGKEEGQVTIYPNPSSKSVNVDLSGIGHRGESVELVVTDMEGRVVLRRTIEVVDSYPLETGGLTANTYQLSVIHGDQVWQTRLVKVD